MKLEAFCDGKSLRRGKSHLLSLALRHSCDDKHSRQIAACYNALPWRTDSPSTPRCVVDNPRKRGN
jgi:hypothetical protein